jgi:hypothetical protein
VSLLDAYHGFTSALPSGQLDKHAEFADPEDQSGTMKAIPRYPVTGQDSRQQVGAAVAAAQPWSLRRSGRPR